ncbi:hypothetical protein O3P69_019332 [Scylla paramamosain]|uniref:Uncharacterized protein n=1 Tax=Scylla paramamosain TaxID=85552 RepID=A0AAW0SX77_SCYPA
MCGSDCRIQHLGLSAHSHSDLVHQTVGERHHRPTGRHDVSATTLGVKPRGGRGAFKRPQLASSPFRFLTFLVTSGEHEALYSAVGGGGDGGSDARCKGCKLLQPLLCCEEADARVWL